MAHYKNRILFLCIGVCVFIATAAILVFSGSVVMFGQNIPQTDLQADYLVGYLWSIALGVAIFVWCRSKEDGWALLNIWLIKSCVTLGFMLFYEYNYRYLDAYSYFNVPSQYDYQWSSSDLISGTDNLYYLVRIYYKIMPYSYHALKVTFSMVGLIGIYLFYRAAVVYMNKADIRLLYILSLFPSILFWSSIVGKDPIILLGVALYAYGVLNWYRCRLNRYLLVIAGGIVLTMTMRIWMGPILVGPLLMIYLRGMRRVSAKILAGFAIAGVLVVLWQILRERFTIGSIQDILRTLNVLSRSWSEDGGSGQVINIEFTSIHNVLVFLPLGMFTALLRPLPGEIPNLFGLLAGLENLVLLALSFLAIKRTRLKELRDPVIGWLVLLVFTWAALYGFISYQNLGTAVRFRLQILPLFLCLLLYLSRNRRKADAHYDLSSSSL